VPSSTSRMAIGRVPLPAPFNCPTCSRARSSISSTGIRCQRTSSDDHAPAVRRSIAGDPAPIDHRSQLDRRDSELIHRQHLPVLESDDAYLVVRKIVVPLGDLLSPTRVDMLESG